LKIASLNCAPELAAADDPDELTTLPFGREDELAVNLSLGVES
jgi:hypothetical protein